MRVGAIDVGTNTTRLLVAELTRGGYRDIDRRLVFTRLGEGVDQSSTLSAGALERTLRVVAEFCAVCGELGAQSIRVAGTSALRDASNGSEFVASVKSLTGVVPEVLPGEEEARLAFRGATRDLGDSTYLVCDIGGGSTELILGEPGSVDARVSMNIGSVRLTERYLPSDPPATEEMLLMEAHIDDQLAESAETIQRGIPAGLVGVAGTVTSLAAMYLGLETYDPSLTHGARLSRAAVQSLYRHLASLSVEQRRSLPSLPEGRADVIVAGVSILARVMAWWPFEELVVSERDILDGIVMEMFDTAK